MTLAVFGMHFAHLDFEMLLRGRFDQQQNLVLSEEELNANKLRSLGRISH